MQMLEVQENSTTRNTIYHSNHACSQRMICISIQCHAPCSLHSQQARGLPPSGSGNLPSTHVWCKVERCLQARVDRAEGLQHGAHHGQLACTRSTREGVSIRMRQKWHCSIKCIVTATDYWCSMSIKLLHSSHDRHCATCHAAPPCKSSFPIQLCCATQIGHFPLQDTIFIAQSHSAYPSTSSCAPDAPPWQSAGRQGRAHWECGSGTAQKRQPARAKAVSPWS